MNVVRQTARSVHFLALLARSDSIPWTLQKAAADGGPRERAMTSWPIPERRQDVR
jgi:hypothetical protein